MRTTKSAEGTWHVSGGAYIRKIVHAFLEGTEMTRCKVNTPIQPKIGLPEVDKFCVNRVNDG